MWRNLVLRFPHVELRDPATAGALTAIESRTGQKFPQSLRSLLMETDEIDAQYGTELVWRTEKIFAENVAFRDNEQFLNLYMPFDALLFFGDNGAGNQFAFVRSPEREDIFVWDHETDSRTWVSPSLESFLRSSLRSGSEEGHDQ